MPLSSGSSKISPVKDTIRFTQLILRTALYFAPLRVFWPLLLALWVTSSAMLTYDYFVRDHLSDRALLVIAVSMNATMLALIADMIDKRLP